jgi:hypothetical protein
LWTRLRLKPQREDDRVLQLFAVSGRQLLVCVGHGRTIARMGERIKNEAAGLSRIDQAQKSPAQKLMGPSAGQDTLRPVCKKDARCALQARVDDFSMTAPKRKKPPAGCHKARGNNVARP